MNVAILGTTDWARALATLVAEAGHQPRIGYREKALPGFPGSPNLAGVVAESRLAIVAVPPEQVRETISLCKPGPRDRVIVASRGLEPDTGTWLSEVVTQSSACLRVGSLAGPALSAEVLRRRPTALVVASRFDEVAVAAQQVFHSRLCRAYTSRDLRGVEISGALVGVLAAAIGIADSLNLGVGMHGVIVTRGIAEARRLGTALGADDRTFSGLAGIGDLLSSASHPDNPWYRAGRQIGDSEPVDEHFARGAEAVVALAAKYGVDLPLSGMVAATARNELEPMLAIDALMRREARAE